MTDGVCVSIESHRRAGRQDISAKHIDKAAIQGRSEVILFRDKCMLEPVHENLAKKHSQHGIQRAEKHVHVGIELKARRQWAHSTRPTHGKGARQLK